MPDPQKRLLTSAAAAKRLGVGATAIKRWSDSGLLRCVKTAGGHRRFLVADVDRFAIAGTGRDQVDRWSEWMTALVGSPNVHAVLALLFAERARRATWGDVAGHVGELLHEMGERWLRGEMTVAQEHIASALLARALALLAETIALPEDANRCLLAAAEGDEHTLALSLAEVCLREAGWRSEWIGSRTRSADVCERVKAGQVRMVALSASAAMSDRRVLRAQVRIVGGACQRAGIPLVLGGTGRWPDPPAFGSRIRSWHEFLVVLRSPSRVNSVPRTGRPAPRW
jgi:MerR family transcriptional regulator, light-induced transcriptional regulator